MTDYKLLSEIGVAGVILILVLRMVFQYLKSSPTSNAETITSKEIHEKIKDIENVLTVKSDEGKPLIYTSPSIEKALATVVENDGKFQMLMQRQQTLLEAQTDLLKKIDGTSMRTLLENDATFNALIKQQISLSQEQLLIMKNIENKIDNK